MAHNVSTVTRKGQVTIPIELRRRLNIHEGDQVEFLLESGFVRVVKAEKPANGVKSEHEPSAKLKRIREISAQYRTGKPAPTIAEIKAAAADGWIERETRAAQSHPDHRDS